MFGPIHHVLPLDEQFLNEDARKNNKDHFEMGQGKENMADESVKRGGLTRLKEKAMRPKEVVAVPQQQEDKDINLYVPWNDAFLLSLAGLTMAPPSPLCFRAVVEDQGFLSFLLTHDIKLDIAPDQTVRLQVPSQGSGITLTEDQLAVVHPTARLLQYGPRIELQVEDVVSVKNAKVFPRGISFTANTCALVYLVDEAGVRTTSDCFHDLLASNIEATLFMETLWSLGPVEEVVEASVEMLERVEYWQEEGRHCWQVGALQVRQEQDGLVTVDRREVGRKFYLRASPTTGKVRVDTGFLTATASTGEEGHVFLRSSERRVHYRGDSGVVVRQGGHSAGFDGEGTFRIF